MSDDPVARFGGETDAPSVPPTSPPDGRSATVPSYPDDLPVGEILTPEQLQDYARELARGHRLAPRPGPARPLLA
jgi:hypothetical protein